MVGLVVIEATMAVVGAEVQVRKVLLEVQYGLWLKQLI
tara:strand:- start:229 stop:342 length:114 start_codon:yes stop_codon:yes gene_type:complete